MSRWVCWVRVTDPNPTKLTSHFTVSHFAIPYFLGVGVGLELGFRDRVRVRVRYWKRRSGPLPFRSVVLQCSDWPWFNIKLRALKTQLRAFIGWGSKTPRQRALESSIADPGFAKGGTMASARSASLNVGLGAEPPAVSRGRAPGWGSGGKSP